MPDERYRISSPQVIHETVDDETIVVNLETGSYYALNRSGSSLWAEIYAGAPVEALIAAVADRFPEIEDAGPSVRAFVDQLAAEGLVAPRDDGTPQGPALDGWAGFEDFESPRLSCYTDMQELLLLDPVHEVGAEGWPARG